MNTQGQRQFKWVPCPITKPIIWLRSYSIQQRYTKTKTNTEIWCHTLHTSAPCPPPHNLAALIQHRRGPRCLGLAYSHFLTLSPGRQGSTSCSILPSRMEEYGVVWENMMNTENKENMEKMESVNQMTKNTLLMIPKTIFFNQNTLFVKKITRNTLFYSIKHARRNDPGSPRNGRTSSKMWSPVTRTPHRLCNILIS